MDFFCSLVDRESRPHSSCQPGTEGLGHPLRLGVWSGSVVTQWHLSVANHIIRIDFGPVVATVCRPPAFARVSTFAIFAKGTSLLPSQVRNALLVLLQHNRLNAYRAPPVSCRRIATPPSSMRANSTPSFTVDGIHACCCGSASTMAWMRRWWCRRC